VGEVADQLAVLGVDAEDGQCGGGELSALGGDVGQLLVAVGVAGAGQLLVVDPQSDRSEPPARSPITQVTAGG
jgi:hypothetical protein